MTFEDLPDRVGIASGTRVYCENCGADLGELEENHGPACHAVHCHRCGWKPECE
jgi:hypothetical protein